MQLRFRFKHAVEISILVLINVLTSPTIKIGYLFSTSKFIQTRFRVASL